MHLAWRARYHRPNARTNPGQGGHRLEFAAISAEKASMRASGAEGRDGGGGGWPVPSPRCLHRRRCARSPSPMPAPMPDRHPSSVPPAQSGGARTRYAASAGVDSASGRAAAAAGAGRAAARRRHSAAAPLARRAPVVPAGQVALYLTRAFRPRHGADPERHRLAHLSRPARRCRRDAAGARGQVRGADHAAAARRLYRACQLRHRAGAEEGAIARRDRARGVRHSGRRHPHRGQGRRCPHPVRADPFRHLQGQPVRAGRQASAHAECDDRRSDAGAGRHLSHRLALRRRQCGGALRHPRAGGARHRRDGHPSRRRRSR